MPLRAGLLAAFVVSMFFIPRGALHAFEIGNEAPAFSLQDLSGRVTALSDLQGRVVLLHFWSVLCGPCVEEMPLLNKLQEQYPKDQLQILAVSIDPAQRARDFVTDNHLEITVLIDSDKEVFFDAYAGPALPASFLIDRNGVIRDRIDGPASWNSPAMQSRLQRLLTGKRNRR